MDLFEEFCNQIGLSKPSDAIDIRYKIDDSDFVVLDGEEGDSGIIRYYSLDGKLLAVRNVYGGDDEDTEFTSYAISLMKLMVQDILIEKFKQISVYNK